MKEKRATRGRPSSVFNDWLRTRNDPGDIGIHTRRRLAAGVFFFLAVHPDYSFISLLLLPGALFVSLVCALPAHPLPSFEVGAVERGCDGTPPAPRSHRFSGSISSDRDRRRRRRRRNHHHRRRRRERGAPAPRSP